MFGFTNDIRRLTWAREYETSAKADGWLPERSPRWYARDGFVMAVKAEETPKSPVGKYQAEVTVWGPDGLQIEVPKAYSMEAIRAALRICMYCHRNNIDTQRVGFAGRVCSDCLPEQRKQQEVRGWAD